MVRQTCPLNLLHYSCQTLEFTSRPELSLRAAESGHNSMCQNGLKVLLRVTVRTKKRDTSAISSGVAALKTRRARP